MPCLNRHGEAAAKSLSPAYADLANKLDTACTEVPSPGMSACLERAQQNADKELNEAYARAMKSIDNDDTGRKWREHLRLAQQAWLHFRDADCGDLTTSEWSGGTGMGPAIITCQLGHTEARTAELNRRYGSK
ncbi:lysozyme inhibitor LprI family protein [Methylobacterium sp. NMS12]|uniref:lysozyme inhibitor LprI family protein n=1 Tax=Methylobacterium sp. NMS12 TaxID=3079766 RepID=UPI003F8842AB